MWHGPDSKSRGSLNRRVKRHCHCASASGHHGTHGGGGVAAASARYAACRDARVRVTRCVLCAVARARAARGSVVVDQFGAQEAVHARRLRQVRRPSPAPPPPLLPPEGRARCVWAADPTPGGCGRGGSDALTPGVRCRARAAQPPCRPKELVKTNLKHVVNGTRVIVSGKCRSARLRQRAAAPLPRCRPPDRPPAAPGWQHVPVHKGRVAVPAVH